MALFHCNFHSEVLGLACSMDVILPQPTMSQIGLTGAAGAGPHKTLYLLHGMSDDHTIWQRRTSIERYVAPLGLAVVMPAVDRSFYTDMARGPRYFTFMSEELPALCRSFFPLSEKREDTFVAGLSMGGYGAFKLALTCPEKYAGAASLSGALHMAGRAINAEDAWRREMENTFGPLEQLAGSKHDLLHLAAELTASGRPRPKLWAWCGTDDFLLEHNRVFKAHAEGIGLELEYSEGPGGHEWGRWDEHIQRVLEWLGV
ncbi:MAG: esterase family protein [Armatimonadetes bacterium]|nr:esterase family protein [Armatimonadota bacterium]